MTYEIDIDTQLAEALSNQAETARLRSWAAATLRRNAGQKQDRKGLWDGSLGDAIEHASKSGNAWDQRDLNEYYERVSKDNVAALAVGDLEHLYNGWSRFFLVTNTNGHIHRSMNCSTCYASTTYAWLPQLSGKSEAEAVADQGEILCSVCFPSAPVAWTTGVSKASVEAREARDAKKAAAAAKKAEKALGRVLVVGRWKDRIDTIAAAKRFLTDAAEWKLGFGAEDQMVAEALAARLGTTAQEELEAAAKRAAKRK